MYFMMRYFEIQPHLNMIYQLHEHIHHHSLGYQIDDKLLRYILLQAYSFNKDEDNDKKQTILIYEYFI